MKTLLMALDGHLILQEITLAPGLEWTAGGEGWRFLNVQSGEGYWLGSEPIRISAGESLMLSPITRGYLRSSQLGTLHFHHFSFHPERLADLISPMERQYLEAEETRQRLAIKVFPAQDPVSRHFNRISSESQAQNSLSCRSAILQIVATAVGMEGPTSHPPRNRLPSARDRFQDLLSQMSESLFIHCSLENLAIQCRCSTRHLSRLFYEMLGSSFSARQTEVRMVKASQLLLESDLKISQVALECGYRHLGLFNATFKRRWKMTPSQWRKSQRDRSLQPNSAIG